MSPIRDKKSNNKILFVASFLTCFIHISLFLLLKKMKNTKNNNQQKKNGDKKAVADKR